MEGREGKGREGGCNVGYEKKLIGKLCIESED